MALKTVKPSSSCFLKPNARSIFKMRNALNTLFPCPCLLICRCRRDQKQFHLPDIQRVSCFFSHDSKGFCSFQIPKVAYHINKFKLYYIKGTKSIKDLVHNKPFEICNIAQLHFVCTSRPTCFLKKIFTCIYLYLFTFEHSLKNSKSYLDFQIDLKKHQNITKY